MKETNTICDICGNDMSSTSDYDVDLLKEFTKDIVEKFNYEYDFISDDVDLCSVECYIKWVKKFFDIK